MRKGEVKTVQVRAVENGFQVHDMDGFERQGIGKGYVAVDDEHLIDVLKDILGVG